MRILCSALVLLTVVVPALAAERADMILLNGRVLTVDPAFSIRSTVVIREGKILAVGGPELARQWQLRAYPTLIIFDPKGKPVLGSVGFIKADDLVKFGKQALKK